MGSSPASSMCPRRQSPLYLSRSKSRRLLTVTSLIWSSACILSCSWCPCESCGSKPGDMDFLTDIEMLLCFAELPLQVSMHIKRHGEFCDLCLQERRAKACTICNGRDGPHHLSQHLVSPSCGPLLCANAILQTQRNEEWAERGAGKLSDIRLPRSVALLPAVHGKSVGSASLKHV